MHPPKQAFRTLITAMLAILLSFIMIFGVSSTAVGQAGQISKDEAQQRLENLHQEIIELQESLTAARSKHRREQEDLREMDLRLDRTARQAKEFERAQATHRAELDRLEADKAVQLASMDEKRDQLAEILRSAYQVDRHSRIKLVLNQDDPAELNRMLAYYEYFNRRHIENIALLKESLDLLEQTQLRISEEISALEATRLRLAEALQELSAQRQDRLDLLVRLDERIGDDEARLQELEQNRQDLVSLLERLEDALADIPADLGSRLGVAQQKGSLPMPLSGRVLHAYGQRRAGTLHWQGWLIGAEAGAEVTPVAYGRVAFADWLRGYGLMLIVDHGDGFLSLYGNNESLFADVGDWVEPGELISVVGSNPGMSQGLYFELRKDGKAVDPAAWVKR